MPTIKGLTKSATRQLRQLLTLNSINMEDEVAEVVSFPDTSLLRATKLTEVMHCCASILAESAGSEETFALSQLVDSIDAFLSHNWTVPRWKKFLCLILHFNLQRAVWAGLTVLALVACAASLGFRMCTLVVNTPGTEEDNFIGAIEHSWTCTILMAPVTLAFAAFGHEVQWLLGFRRCKVFLDKSCIDQTDDVRQQQAIKKLGAFLRCSSRMVVLYSDVYLTKLWTVYEAACFLSMHPSKRLKVVPLYQPVLVFGGIAIGYMNNLILISLYSYSELAVVARASVTFLCAIAAAVVLRRAAREKHAMYQRVEHFDLYQCVCSVEKDRPLVHQNIAVLMRGIGKVGRETSDEVALDAFNDLVRTRLYRSITNSIGHIGLQYRQVTAIFLCYLAPWYFDVRLLGHVPSQELVARYRICTAANYAFWIFGGYPLITAVLSIWCSKCLHIRRYQEWAFLCTCVALLGVCSFWMEVMVWRLVIAAVVPGPYRFVYIAVLFISVINVVLMARRIFRLGGERKQAELQEEEELEAIEARESYDNEESGQAFAQCASCTSAPEVSILARVSEEDAGAVFDEVEAVKMRQAQPGEDTAFALTVSEAATAPDAQQAQRQDCEASLESAQRDEGETPAAAQADGHEAMGAQLNEAVAVCTVQLAEAPVEEVKPEDEVHATRAHRYASL